LRIVLTKLKAIEGTLASQRVATISRATTRLAFRVRLADEGSKQRIGTKEVVVEEVFISKSESKDSLRDEVFKRMFDQKRVTEIFEASSELRDDFAARLKLAQKQRR
jgi:hypothetical protein